MRTCRSFTSARLLRRNLCVAVVCSTMSALSVGAFADAAAPGTITITATRDKVVGRDPGTNAPIIQHTAHARVPYVPVTLTTNSGVALLKDRVATAAREMCADLDTFGGPDSSCVRQAIDDAQPQIDAAINRAEEKEARS